MVFDKNDSLNFGWNRDERVVIIKKYNQHINKIQIFASNLY